jgi:hypothetical protein
MLGVSVCGHGRRRCEAIGTSARDDAHHKVTEKKFFEMVLAAKDCTTIFPWRMTNVWVANS